MLQRNFDQPDHALEEPSGPAIERWPQPTVDLREMARILRRRWKMVAAPALSLLALALIYLLAATTLYTATSTVLVDPRRSTAIESNQAAMQMSNFGTDDHFGYFANANRHAVLRIDDDVFDLVDVRGLPHTLHEHGLRAFANDSAADIAIVFFNRLHDLIEC